MLIRGPTWPQHGAVGRLTLLWLGSLQPFKIKGNAEGSRRLRGVTEAESELDRPTTPALRKSPPARSIGHHHDTMARVVPLRRDSKNLSIAP